ncbi:NAD(P)-dependent oxidoreductase [Budvicia aquatica]|nr:NAD(P)-dependent oxidoreductase [Budvicia aquatica]VFS45889.1 D-3-phosphoglycerate dehydrogenase [Budvicia aquatica]
MQKGTFIINTARGELIDEDALYDALDRGHLGGAGLDAFKDEPMTDQRFFKLNNVILTPHTGAFTSEASENSLIIAAQEVLRVLSEELPHYAVK